MTKKLERLKMTLPSKTIEEFRAIAKLANVAFETVIKVAIATQMYKLMRQEKPHDQD